MPFIDQDFLLQSDAAKKLYHDYAADQPIYDYHCHLPPQDLAANRQFNDLFEMWLEGDHYKWRAMRANGVAERFCTGDASPWEKFEAWAKTVPHTLGNPLYHWTHLELQRYFGIDTLLNGDTAREIWDQANQQIRQTTVADLMAKFQVALIGTTDDPADSLEHHQKLNENSPYPDTAIYPAFRPDKTHNLTDVKNWNEYVDGLEDAAGINCDKFAGFIDAVRQRHAFFHKMGSRLSDHGLTHLPVATCTEKEAKKIYKAARDGTQPDPKDQDKFTVYMMLLFGELDAEADWTKQLHLGAMRNNNPKAFDQLGPDTGFDSIGDYPQGQGLSQYFGTLAGRGHVPRFILYNLNPRDNYLFATMVGNFQDGKTPGKAQFGSGWWFLDQKQGMTWQLTALSNLGLLTRFVGMLTDSRSFLSYPRHEYFRRILCNLLGQQITDGQLPGDMDMVGQVVRNICFNNARNYFQMQLKGQYA